MWDWSLFDFNMYWLDVHTMLRSIYIRFGTPYLRLALTNKLTKICKHNGKGFQYAGNVFQFEHCLITIFSLSTSPDARMLTSTAARIVVLVCLADARSLICTHCVQSADLQVCFLISFAGFPTAVGVVNDKQKHIFQTVFGSRSNRYIKNPL